MYMPYIEDLGAEKPSAAADLGNHALHNSAHQSKQGRLPSQACQKLYPASTAKRVRDARSNRLLV